jgi:hypothetical protein
MKSWPVAAAKTVARPPTYPVAMIKYRKAQLAHMARLSLEPIPGMVPMRRELFRASPVNCGPPLPHERSSRLSRRQGRAWGRHRGSAAALVNIERAILPQCAQRGKFGQSGRFPDWLVQRLQRNRSGLHGRVSWQADLFGRNEWTTPYVLRTVCNFLSVR